MNDYSSTWDATWNSTKDERWLELIAVSAQATSEGEADKVSAMLAAGVCVPLSSARRSKRAKALQKRTLERGWLPRCASRAPAGSVLDGGRAQVTLHAIRPGPPR